MGNSLQDQLLKAGLIDAKQAKKAKAGKPPPKKKKKQRGEAELSDSARAAQQAQAAKLARDRELEAKRKAEAERKALGAQVRQLIEQHRLDREGAEIDYHFTDQAKVRRLLVTAAIQSGLVKGRMDIVRLGDRYEVVPAEVAEKIRQRDPDAVMPRNAAEQPADPDDPYADYQVPDDLMW